MKKECAGKHTKFQPTEEQWRCPQCGGGPDVFFIDYHADDITDPVCGFLHTLDYVICTTCAKSWSGRAIAATLMRKASLVPCSHCNGTGFAEAEECAGEREEGGRS